MEITIESTVGESIQSVCTKVYHTAIKLGEPVETIFNDMRIVCADDDKYWIVTKLKEPKDVA